MCLLPVVTVIMVRPLVPVPEANGQVRVCAKKDIQTAGPVDAVITTAPGKATGTLCVCARACMRACVRV